MPNIASLLKLEISRLSRREIRREVQPLRKAAATHRREIAALKRTVGSLQRQLKRAARSAPMSDAAGDSEGKQIRFVAKGLRSQRTRLGLSAPALARLLGVSVQSIYNWETKKAVPRAGQMEAIVALRSAGKREIQERLAQTKSSARSTKRRRAK
jgi:DNA-binding transcriptional regulator YiaG